MGDSYRPSTTSCNDPDVRLRTSDLIIEVLNALMFEGDYEAGMRNVLEILSKAIHADRLYILEMRRRFGSAFVELCAEGVPPRLAAIARVSDAALANFVKQFRGRGVIFAETLDELVTDKSRETERAYFRKLGVHSLFSLPLYVNGRSLGCLAADNYQLDDDYDIMRLLDAIGPCMATVVAKRQYFEELEWMGTHDPLTGLLNRRGVDLKNAQILEERPDVPCVLALVDVDDFKAINDVHGHEAGDEALKVLAQTLQTELPATAVLGRNGGDEFVAILFGEDGEKADEVFSRIGNASISFESAGQEVPLTISLGYVSCPDQASSLSKAYQLADAALYAVKLAGKAQAMRYSNNLDFRYRSQLGFTPRDIADNIPGGILVYQIGGNGTILFANKNMADLFGCSDLNEFMDSVKGCFRYLVHPDDEEATHASIISQVAPDDVGKELRVSYRIIARDGRVREVLQCGRVVEVEGVGTAIYAILIDTSKGH